MSQSLAQIYLHIVFSTKVRIPFLKEKKVRDDLYAYMAGICKNLDSPAQMVGGGRGSCALALPPFEEFGAVAFSAGVEKGLVKVGENSGGQPCRFSLARWLRCIFGQPQSCSILSNNTLPIRKSIISGKRSKMSFGGYAESMASRSMSDMFGIRKYDVRAR